jgi:hypothetical protein
MAAELAEDVERALLAHPAVRRLDGGPFGTTASYLPGRRVTGVRIVGSGEEVEVSVVLRLSGTPLPEVVRQLRDRVTAVAGRVPVHVTVADLAECDEKEVRR